MNSEISKERKKDMLAMRIDGYTLQQIADKYGISRQRVNQIFQNIAKSSSVERKKYVYPNIAVWMQENGLTQQALAKMLGSSQETISAYLKGRFDPNMKFIRKILELSELPFEIAFCVGHDADE